MTHFLLSFSLFPQISSAFFSPYKLLPWLFSPPNSSKEPLRPTTQYTFDFNFHRNFEISKILRKPRVLSITQLLSNAKFDKILSHFQNLSRKTHMLLLLPTKRDGRKKSNGRTNYVGLTYQPKYTNKQTNERTKDRTRAPICYALV